MKKASMQLSKLLDRLEVSKMYQTLYGQMVVTHDIIVNNVQYDSRKVERGDLFVAIKGIAADGNAFITQAVQNGAKVVVTERDDAIPDSFCMHNGIVKVVVNDSRAALARISDNFYDHPSRNLAMVGVTGTNGKTTTTNVIKYLLQQTGRKTGLIGTIENAIGDFRLPATHTTPESLELNALLARMVEEQCTAAVMEVSSHGLHQHRVDGMNFRVAVFTNLTQDHLDYHGTMEDYYDAKKILFSKLASDGCAVINIDDGYGRKLASEIRENKITYGILPDADVRAGSISLSLQGVSFFIEYRGERTNISSPMVGKFNVYNLLAAFSCGTALGISGETLGRLLSGPISVAGRFEKISAPMGWIAIVDYAHTPDALEKTLMAIHDIKGKSDRGNIITVFGCGGNRDKSKRPAMGGIASRLSNIVFVTSDNPRHEEPELIINEIMAGIESSAKVYREVDRATAIAKALKSASKDDIILIAGKGHEDYQIIGDRKIHFSDQEIVKNFLRSRA